MSGEKNPVMPGEWFSLFVQRMTKLLLLGFPTQMAMKIEC